LLHIGVRSICAGIAALAVGVALESVGRYAVDAFSAGPEAEAARTTAFETVPAKRLDHRASLVHVASLATDVDFTSAIEESAAPVSTHRRDSFGERFLFDQGSDSFNERFASAYAFPAETEEGSGSVLSYAPAPTSVPTVSVLARPATARSGPKLASVTSAPPPSVVRKRIASLEVPKDAMPAPEDDSRTAIYDISARTVYLPNGRRLEAHSGLGDHMDDIRSVNLRAQGPTPPNVYKLTMREALFHGVRAIRLTPVGDGKMYGRDGLLAHSYMLGPNGQSNGCVSFSDYPAFLNAYLRGEVDRLVVVEHLDSAPSPKTATGWLPESLKDLFRRS
jgi:hypothetical protein